MQTDLHYLVNTPVPRILESDLLAHDVLRHFEARGAEMRFLGFLQWIDRLDAMACADEEACFPLRPVTPSSLQELVEFVTSACEVLHRAPGECAEVLAQLTTMRCVLVILYVSQRNPHFLGSLVSLVETGGVAPHLVAIRRRFKIFGNACLLGDIFSADRQQRIASIMESYIDE